MNNCEGIRVCLKRDFAFQVLEELHNLMDDYHNKRTPTLVWSINVEEEGKQARALSIIVPMVMGVYVEEISTDINTMNILQKQIMQENLRLMKKMNIELGRGEGWRKDGDE